MILATAQDISGPVRKNTQRRTPTSRRIGARANVSCPSCRSGCFFWFSVPQHAQAFPRMSQVHLACAFLSENLHAGVHRGLALLMYSANISFFSSKKSDNQGHFLSRVSVINQATIVVMEAVVLLVMCYYVRSQFMIEFRVIWNTGSDADQAR